MSVYLVYLCCTHKVNAEQKNKVMEILKLYMC